MAIALTYSDVLLISSDSLHRVMMIHPDASEVIRHRILKYEMTSFRCIPVSPLLQTRR